MDGSVSDLIYLLLFFAYGPALALLWYFYHQDKLEPEPKKFVVLTFIYGAIMSVGISLFFESLTGNIIPKTFFTMALIAAVVEEPSKALAIRIPYNAKQMDGVMDGVVYGVAAGLGFAATENLLYGIGFGIEVTLMRVLLTPLAHAIWSAVIGVGYGLKSEGKAKSLTLFFIAAIILHFSWNYFAFKSSENFIYGLAVFFIMFLNLALIKHLLYLGKREDMEKYGYIKF